MARIALTGKIVAPIPGVSAYTGPPEGALILIRSSSLLLRFFGCDQVDDSIGLILVTDSIHSSIWPSFIAPLRDPSCQTLRGSCICVVAERDPRFLNGNSNVLAHEP